MPNNSQILTPQKPFEVSPFYVPEASPFYAPNPKPTFQPNSLCSDSEENDAFEPPRGRKRRRSSAASIEPAQQMSTLRGRGRNRSLSSPNEEEEVESESADDLDDSEEDSSIEGQTSRKTKRFDIVLVASRGLLAAIAEYFNTRPASFEMRAVISEFETTVTEGIARHYSNANDNKSNVEDGSSEVIEKATAVLDIMRTLLANHDLTPALSFRMKKLEDLIQKSVAGEVTTATNHRPSTSAPFTFPLKNRLNDGPHVKKRRSQSPSRSHSVGGEIGKSPKPRRRQRTRSRSRSHGLVRDGAPNRVVASH